MLPGLVWARVLVHIPPEVEVRGGWVLLGEIAQIEGDDPLKAKELKELVLGRAPLPGGYRYLRRGLIEAKLQGVDLRCPPKVKVKRAFQRIPPQKVAELAIRHVKGRLSFATKVEVSGVRVRGEVILPKGRWSHLVLDRGKVLGRTSLVVLFRVGEFQRRALVDMEVKALARVAVASRRLPRWHLIQEGDMVLEQRELSRLLGFVTDPREVLGKRTRVSIPRGTVLRWDQLEVPPLIKKGKVVTMVLETPFIRATALGVAVEDGRRGDLIRVRNLSSKREVFAEVLNGSTVEVSAF